MYPGLELSADAEMLNAVVESDRSFREAYDALPCRDRNEEQSTVEPAMRCDAMRSEIIQLIQAEVAGDVLLILVACI